ncbi:bifunctional diguanylate cyclase/phosphodiesterase [Oceanicoccus sp. KOV_DT_Chl]|uniref:putative bifunctional diguanylate cyclase/phosphodiesterase n=1 Tax=Oceanicoccus sp. KOV_DT_Chl TaxID=1904639 RepID=UPI000C7B4466|nr:bifunctional diguanylate cyclase/phosphodiesterase [Oceanicoccus sp. KOV_DT_Chl]
MPIRNKIFGIYAVMVLLGIGLSITILISGRAIDATSKELLEKNVPLLDDISTVKVSVIEYERILYEYYATTDQQEMTRRHESIHRVLEQAFHSLTLIPENRPILNDIRQICDEIHLQAESLDQTLSSNRIDWDLSRDQLASISNLGRQITPLLDEMRARIQAEVIGTASLVETNTQFTTRLVGLFSLVILLVAALVAFYLDRYMQAQNKLGFLAYHDALTGLQNRQQFEEGVAALAAGNEQFTVGLIKIDRFNVITAGHGYGVGDAIIRAVGEALCEVVKEYGGEQAQAFRFEGASFGFIANAPAMTGLIKQLLRRFERPLIAKGSEFYISIAIGYVQYPDDEKDVSALIQDADAALSRISRHGSGEPLRFKDDMRLAEQSWLAIESDLRAAIANEELVLFYQPQICAQTGTLVGVEALIRWQSPHRGMVPPIDFIPIAEQTGLIVSIGEWVIKQACEQAKRWQQAGVLDCVVAVNISPKQFLHHNFVQTVAQLLTASGVDPAFIEFEITEGVMVENTEHCIDILEQLKALGLNLSIDDFGTGYSSLTYLKRFKIDKLKVDQAFIKNLPTDTKDLAIVRTIIDLAHNLGLKVIAEGVETETQAEWLRSYGCEELQGYLISRPQPALELADFFARTARMNKNVSPD